MSVFRFRLICYLVIIAAQLTLAACVPPVPCELGPTRDHEPMCWGLGCDGVMPERNKL